MRKNIVFICFSAFYVCSGTLSAQKNIIDEVIWTVGDEVILKSDVEDYKRDAQRSNVTIEGNPNCAVPEQIAINKLFLHQAKIDSIFASENWVQMNLEFRMNQYLSNFGSRETMERYMEKSYNAIREELANMLRDQSVIQQVQQKLVAHIKPTPAEVRRYYNSLNKDSVPTVPAAVELQIVSVQPPIPLEEINRTKERLREFSDRVNSGNTEFSMLARLYSEDEGTARMGGETGFKGRGEFVPEFSAVAFSLTDPAKVSRIVETEYGFHILQLVERRGDRVNVRHILLKPRVTSIDREKATHLLDSIASRIREGKITFEQAVMFFSQDKSTAMNAGLMLNENQEDANNRFYGTSKFEYKHLPSEVAKKVYEMKVGEISDPFSMINNKNKEIVAVVKVKSKTDTHKANLIDDYQLITQIYENQQQQNFIAEWIRKKQKETYISIDPAWSDCEFQYPGWVKK